MDLPKEILVGNIVIEEGKIYRFYESIPEGSNIKANHMHICFIVRGTIVCLVCASRDKEGKMKKWVESRDIDKSTIVKISPSSDNGFSVDSFLNCNQISVLDYDELVSRIESEKVVYWGEVSQEEISIIKNAVLKSPVVAPFIKNFIKNT